MPKKKPSPSPDPAKPSVKLRPIALALALPLVGFAAWRGGIVVYDQVQHWRGARLATQAAELLQKGDPAAARSAAEASLACDPRNIDSLRLLAGFQLDSGEDVPALATFGELSALGGLSQIDALRYARLAARLCEWDTANGLVAALRAGPASVETPLLEADIAILRKDPVRAESLLREAAGLDTTNRSRDLLADFLLDQRFDRETAAEVRDLLIQSNRLSSPVGLRALSTALEKNLAPPQETPKWISELRAHPLSSPDSHLIADSAEVRFDPASKSRIAESLVQRVLGSPLENRKSAVMWLAQNGEPARAARLLDLSEAASEPALFEAWLDSLNAANRAPEALEAVGTPANPLADWRTALQRGRASRLSGRSAEADAAYRQALLLSAETPDRSLALAEFFGRAAEPAYFEEVLARLLADPRRAPEALQKLMPVVRASRDTPGLRAFSEAMATSTGLSPADREILENEIAYCDLVLGKKTDAARVAERSAAHVGDLRFQTTQALALLRAGKNEAAIEELVVTQAPPDDPFLLARHKALQAMALAASGDSDRANLHWNSLPREFLSTQESALVEQFLKKPGRKSR